MKKAILIALALVMTITLLAACGNNRGPLGNLNAAVQQAITEEVRNSGGDVDVHPDGTVDVHLPDGTTGQYGGSWPENEFTKIIPKPDFELTAATTSDREFTVVFVGATTEQIRGYVEKLKAAGFTSDTETEDNEIFGMFIYNFSATNAAGYKVSVFSAVGLSGLSLEKP